MAHDFGGYATKNDIVCADNRVIKRDAFKHQDGQRVPLVWQHVHDSPANVLGHAILENRPDGVYARAYLNSSENANHVRELLAHGDVKYFSINANKLRQTGNDVNHGYIRELSVVLAGANPGAVIDEVALAHSDNYLGDEAIIYTGIELDAEHLTHEEESDDMADDTDEETLEDIFNSFTDKQKNVVYAMLAQVAEGDIEHSDDEDEDAEEYSEGEDNNPEGNEMTHNVFEGEAPAADKNSLTHSQFQSIMSDAMENKGSLKESMLSHAVEYGIEDINLLFPDAKAITPTPEFIKRDTGWVADVMRGVKATPFSRIKSLSADITHEEARAKGYIKGNLKKDEFFKLATRSTTPKTIYKKQKLDRDDIIDVTTIDVVAWLKAEMRMMLEEEIARAILIGDGREVDDEDKINEENIRPIAKDDDFYTHKIYLPANVDPEALIEAVLRSRRHYKGTSPKFYTTEDYVTDMLLIKDRNRRRLYETEASLASALRVTEIVPVEVMEDEPNLVGIIVNLNDYHVGADKGGETSFFDDFDIDFNQYKYLYETRISGALVRHKTAIAIYRAEGTEVVPVAPQFDPETNTVTIPSVTGVEYTVNDEVETGDVVITEDVVVLAHALDGYYFSGNSTRNWSFNYTA